MRTSQIPYLQCCPKTALRMRLRAHRKRSVPRRNGADYFIPSTCDLLLYTTPFKS